MEHLFSPSTRYRDRLESRRGPDEPTDLTKWLQELQELNLDVSTEELLSAERAFTYADLYAMLGNEKTVLWLTPHAAVVAVSAYGTGFMCSIYLRDNYRFIFNVNGKAIFVLPRSSEAFSEIVDIIRRLLLADVSEVNELEFILCTTIVHDERFFNAASLANLMEQCQSLKTLTLEQIDLDEDCIRVLGDFSRPGLEIELRHCIITGAAATVLTWVLGGNQGPTKLDLCDIDNFVLVDGLRGNRRLKIWTPRLSNNSDVGNQELVAIAGALRENKGLVDLNLIHDFTMSNETWDAVCDSLKTHPTLQVLKMLRLHAGETLALAPAVLKSQMQALVDMLKVNMSIQTLHYLDSCHSEHELFRGSVIPYLETNRHRPRVRAIQKARPIAFQAKVLGRALLAVSTDANRFWMLLSGNPEVAFPSTIATTPPAASLPTPVTTVAADTSNAAAVATTFNAATPTACQKRKARP
jgi:hypothetical protein